jgi:hypothetical protein
MFICKYRTGRPAIFYTIKKRECLLANAVTVCAENFPDFWDDFRRQFSKTSLRSDALYAFFNKSLVFCSVISN